MMSHFSGIFVLLAIILGSIQISTSSQSCDVRVQTKHGPVQGAEAKSRNGRTFNSFRGIPFAQPPVGHLRFKPPVKPNHWTKTIDATKEGPFCIQKNYLFAIHPQIQGQEDCLYLNVYSPNIRPKELLPVMAYLNWGGFFAGKANSDFEGPEYLMDKDIVLVVINYRLSALGFLSTGDDASPGNYGLKDQVLGLKWVQENIAKFGGDPARVTLFGSSSGAVSVGHHMISQLSKGLFHQTIVQSCNSLELIAISAAAVQLDNARKVASTVGCGRKVGNNKKMVECLRNVDVDILLNANDVLVNVLANQVALNFLPVVETQTVANPEPFLTRRPLEYYLDGDFRNVSMIIGTVQNEGLVLIEEVIRDATFREQLNANLSGLLPQLLALETSVPEDQIQSLYTNITDFFLGGQQLVNYRDSNSVQGLINIYTDRVVDYSIYQTIILQNHKFKERMWAYNFDYRGEYTYGDLWAATKKTLPGFNFGTAHLDDLLYIFNSPGLFPPLRSKTDKEMIDVMVGLWTDFAIHGSPDPMGLVGWEPLGFTRVINNDINYLSISGSSQGNNIEIRMEEGYFPDRMDFWQSQNLSENFSL